MDPPPLLKQRASTTRKRLGRAKPGTADENGIQQGVAGYGAQGMRRT